MAKAFIGAAVELALSKANSIIDEQINLAWGFQDELNKLRDSLNRTRAFFRDAERRQVDETVKVWLKQLEDIAYKADDLLDELAYEDLRRKVDTRKRIKVSNICSLFKNSMAEKVKEINLRMDEIIDWGSKFGLQQRVQNAAPIFSGVGSTDSFVDSSRVVGREADISRIVDLLIGSTSQQTFSLVSIVGMAGLGKTTLAQSVCKNEKVKNYFNKIVWVCVAENFDVPRILLEMLESLTGETCDMKNKDTVLRKIQKELEGKTYLLVLDDVWDENFKNWEDLWGRLLGINGNKQSSILVTTRNENVAVVRETPQRNRYPLKSLMEDECWAIIKKRAFQNYPISPELEDIGRVIAKKCRGVPLVANVIGGTMCNNQNKDEWVKIRDSPLWGSLESNEVIVGVLKLSFDRLPSPSLKKCFAYCSVLPKDFRIQKEQLIQLWMAEGFLHQSNGSSQLAFEDIGNEYFHHLLSNSLLQDKEMDMDGFITCKMHDLVHDLAESISDVEKLSYETNSTHHNSHENVPDIGVKLWHSLFLKTNAFSIVCNFKGVRVLNFCTAYIDSLPDSISSLIHLRYLDISRTCISRLPESITQLYHLQTLRLLNVRQHLLASVPFARPYLGKLPEGMKNLVSLRHLYIDHPSYVPVEIGCLTSLRTLPVFDVGTESGRGIGELGCLSKLGGTLKIFNLQNVRNKEEARGAKQWKKEKLLKLEYEWSRGREDCCNDEEVVEGLEPHSNLKSLTIKGYKGGHFPLWLVRSISGSSASFQPINLEDLTLSNCENVQNLPILGQYPKLKRLRIEVLPNLRSIECSEVELTFPSLKELKIRYCWKLSSVPIMSRFSSLEELAIDDCGELSWTDDTLFPSTLKKLSITKCSNLRFIRIVGGGISSLQELFLQGFDKLCKIEEGLLGSTCLKEVCIWECPKLTSIPLNGGSQSLWNFTVGKCEELQEIGGGLSACTRLEKLMIEECPNLKSIPINGGSQSLLSFEVRKCEKLGEIEGGLSACTRLETLEIEECSNLISIPSIDGFSSLLSLTLYGCKGLTSLPTGLLACTSLEYLSICNCTNLESIPGESIDSLTRLKTLVLGPFSEELEEFPLLCSIHNLRSPLQHLILNGWEKLSSLPHQLQHFTALENLEISNFHGVKALPEWLGNLSSLRELEIRYCENLMRLHLKKPCNASPICSCCLSMVVLY
ncbi:putative disease resistance protein RGA4 [Durio zibethinus]|uniref:Disease resistance protein RGA4 n=1 Tax=Durio zibethinus TaxID=66656 RepID=A0A6P6A9P7_DURZI|nr:putative disease resistance protein RGA4 [Durio zibethinus]XP_022761487.1 putative disease resistance protein RGA4 [Durio zibethinus]XP_022761488.1 putative disease resistance protein RGA4 [Durio zibethinus]